MRYACKKDENHNLIAEAFEKAGCSVCDTSRAGDDFPDMVVGLHGINVLVEVKRSDVSPSKSKLTEGQFKFFREWKGWMAVIRTTDEAISLVKQMRNASAVGFRADLSIKIKETV